MEFIEIKRINKVNPVFPGSPDLRLECETPTDEPIVITIKRYTSGTTGLERLAEYADIPRKP